MGPGFAPMANGGKDLEDSPTHIAWLRNTVCLGISCIVTVYDLHAPVKKVRQYLGDAVAPAHTQGAKYT